MARQREYPVTGEPGMRPAHPGAILREDVLPALNLSVSEVARHLGVSRQTLHRLLAEKIAVSPDMAVHMQGDHDLWYAARKLKREVARIPTKRAA